MSKGGQGEPLEEDTGPLFAAAHADRWQRKRFAFRERTLRVTADSVQGSPAKGEFQLGMKSQLLQEQSLSAHLRYGATGKGGYQHLP